MPTELDALQLGVSASTSSAERSIDGLINALGRLNNALTMPNFSSYTASLSDFGNELMNLEFAAKSIDSKGIKDLASSINSLTGAGAKLNSLGEAFGQMEDGGNIQKVVQNLNLLQDVHIPDMTNLINVKNSLGKLGGKDAERAISNLPRIAEGLRSLGSGIYIPPMEGLAELAYNLALFGNANNTRTASNLTLIARGLKQFKGINVPDLKGLDSLAHSVAQFGYSSAQKAVTTIPQLAGAFKQLINTLSKAPHVSQNVIDLANSMANLASAGGRAGTAVNAMTPRLNNFSRSCGKAAKSGRGLAQVIGKVYATYWLLFRAFGKLGEAINYSSQLTEVQNVVDTVFGDMKGKLQDFSDRSITTFGMSELSAKQFASRFQAMGAAMGITNKSVASANEYLGGVLDNTKRHIEGVEDSYADLGDSMADVSINLTKLAADMGSFYNVDYEDAADDLASVFTGMTRPLRQYGLDLTEATLREYAMTHGLDSNIKAMTQAEKTMLRYQYVMENMGHVMNDYAITANTWANVTRTIGQQFQKLGSMIGQGFINLLKPVLIKFRDFMNTLIGLVEKGLNAIGKLLGWQVEIQEVGMTMDEGMEDFADATGEAAGKAKKLKDYLLGIDELNVLNPDDGSGSGGGGGATGGGGGSSSKTTGGEFNIKRYESDIDSWFELGQALRDTIVDALNSIDWASIQEAVKENAKGFAELLNGLFSPDEEGIYTLGKAIGHFLAEALNTGVDWFLTFATTFNWHDLGMTIATAVNEFFATFDFKDLANAIDAWVQGIWETIKTAITNVNWKDVWGGIKDFLTEIDLETVAIVIGAITIKHLGQLLTLEALKTFITTKLIGETGVITLAIKSLSIKVLDFAAAASSVGFKNALAGVLGVSPTALSGALATGFSLTAVLGLTLVIQQTILYEGGKAFLNGLLKEQGFEPVSDDEYRANIKLSVNAALKDLPKNTLDKILNPKDWNLAEIATFATPLRSLGDAFAFLGDNSKELTTLRDNIDGSKGSISAFVDLLGDVSEKAKAFSLEDFGNSITSIWDALNKGHDDFVANSQDLDNNEWLNGEKWVQFGESIKTGISNGWNAFIDWWNSDAIANWWDNSVVPWFTGEKWYELGQGIIDGINLKWEEFIAWWNETALVTWWEEDVMPWFTIEKWEEVAQGIKDGIKQKWDETAAQWWTDVQDWWNTKVMPWFTLQKWTDLLKNIGPAFKTAFKGAANNAIDALNGVIAGVETMVNRAIEALNALIGGAGELLAAAGISVSVSLSPVSLPRIPHFAKGGFVPATSYSLFAAGENGIPEMIGTVGGRTAVAGGEEITGIRNAIEASSEREAILMERLIEVEEALMAVVEDKDFTLDDRTIAESNNRGQRLLGYQIRTA